MHSISHVVHRTKRHSGDTPSLLNNHRFLWFVVIFIFGAVWGCRTYGTMSVETKDFILQQIAPPEIASAGSEISGIVIHYATRITIVLFALFLMGMTPYGVPLIWSVCLGFGFCVGLYDGYLFEQNGWFMTFCSILPTILFAASSIITACIQSSHMSYLFSRQLLPFSAHCGSLWQDFKHYLLRYLLCVFLACSAVVCDVILQFVL